MTEVKSFNEKWLELFRWFEEHPGAEKRIPTDTPARAHSFRFEFYKARALMRDDENMVQAYPLTREIEVTLDKENETVVVFKPKAKTPIGELIERSLQKGKRDGE